MPRLGPLGELEELLLLAVRELDGQAYAGVILEAFEEARRKTSLGAIHITLDRLDDRGLITSRWGESRPERGGRRRRYYEITGNGVSALQEMEDTRRRLVTAVGRLLPSGGAS